MATLKEIKRRQTSISSTEQITNAMKITATVKLQKSRSRAENHRLYFNMMYQTIQEMMKRSKGIGHRYLVPGDSKKKAIVVVTSNRGLCAGYNSNVIKLVTGSGFAKEDVEIIAVGKKGREGLANRGYSIISDHDEMIDEPVFSDGSEITDELLDLYTKNEIGEIYLAYTAFKNTMVQIPRLMKLLPVDLSESGYRTSYVDDNDIDVEPPMKDDLLLMNYEPDEDEVLDAIIPKYLASLIYGALLEAVASENGARMTAMDSATKNADDMLSKLSVQYNRARQAAITNELTEIIAGANAIEDN